MRGWTDQFEEKSGFLLCKSLQRMTKHLCFSLAQEQVNKAQPELLYNTDILQVDRGSILLEQTLSSFLIPISTLRMISRQLLELIALDRLGE